MTLRRMGWTRADPVHCPVCGGRLTGHVTLLGHGGMRCRSWVHSAGRQCGATLYVLPFTRIGIAFVAEVAVTDLREMERREMTIWDALQYLGAAFPVDGAPAPTHVTG